MAIPQVGQTISADEFNKLPEIGGTISADQFNALGTAQPEQPKRLSFLQRAKLSFGGPESIQQLKSSEEQAGLRGKPDIGDIADIAGSTLPFIGATAGAPFGPVGVAAGAGVGEAVKRGVGKIFGVRKDVSAGNEALGVGKEVAGTYLGGKVLGFLGDRIAERVPKILGIFAGEEPDAIRAALRNPKATDIGIKQGDEALRNLAQKAGEGAIKIRDTFIKGHTQAMQDTVFKDMGVTRGFSQGAKQDINQAFNNLLKRNRVKIDSSGLNFSTSSIKANPGEVAKVNSAYEAIQNWRDFSQGGTQKLKQLIGEFRKFPTESGGTSKSPVLGQMYHFLGEEVKKGLPKNRIKIYEELNKKFEENINLYDDMVSAFNKGDVFNRLAQAFSKNKDSLRQVIDFYEKKSGQDIMPTIAGRAIGQEKQASFGFLNPREWVDFFVTPKEQARLITTIGKGIMGEEKLKIGRRILPSITVGAQKIGRRLFGDETQ